MKSLRDYSNHFLDELLDTRISWLEMALILSLSLMCVMSAIECTLGRDVGSMDQIRMAKIQGQQEWMALRSTHSPE